MWLLYSENLLKQIWWEREWCQESSPLGASQWWGCRPHQRSETTESPTDSKKASAPYTLSFSTSSTLVTSTSSPLLAAIGSVFPFLLYISHFLFWVLVILTFCVTYVLVALNFCSLCYCASLSALYVANVRVLVKVIFLKRPIYY